MAIGTTLEALVSQLRAETGASTSTAQGNSMLPALKQLLRRTQERLHAEWDWPHLKIEPEEALLPGQRYYTFDPLLDFQRIAWARIKWTGSWHDLAYKEDFTPLYNQTDADDDERSDPVRYWRHYVQVSPVSGNQYEVWPLPQSAQTLRWRGTKKLAALVADTDIADLDDGLLVVFAAARRLKQLKSADADNVQAEANLYLHRLKGQSIKREPFVMGGGLPDRGRMWPGGDWELRAARI